MFSASFKKSSFLTKKYVLHLIKTLFKVRNGQKFECENEPFIVPGINFNYFEGFVLDLNLFQFNSNLQPLG